MCDVYCWRFQCKVLYFVLYVPCIVTNYIIQSTRCNICIIYSTIFCKTLHVSNDHFIHHQEFMIYCILQLCTNHANVSRHVYMLCTQPQNTVNLWTPDDERNGRSKQVELYKNCRINTYRKCIVLVCLYNNEKVYFYRNCNRPGSVYYVSVLSYQKMGNKPLICLLHILYNNIEIKLVCTISLSKTLAY